MLHVSCFYDATLMTYFLQEYTKPSQVIDHFNQDAIAIDFLISALQLPNSIMLVFYEKMTIVIIDFSRCSLFVQKNSS